MMKTKMIGNEKYYNVSDVCYEVGILQRSKEGCCSEKWMALDKYLRDGGYEGPRLNKKEDYINEYDLLNGLVGTRNGKQFVRTIIADIRRRMGEC